MNWISQIVIDLANSVLDILPDSPFVILDNLNTIEFYQYFKWLNWFIPVGEIITLLGAWCSCILVYYIVQIVLRWTKAIE